MAESKESGKRDYDEAELAQMEKHFAKHLELYTNSAREMTELRSKAQEYDVHKVTHAPGLQLLAAKHTELAKKYKDAARREVVRQRKATNSAKADSVKHMARELNDRKAQPLNFAERDRTTITANPQKVDGIVKLAWQKNYQGTAACLETLVETFVDKYGRHSFIGPVAKVPDLTGRRVMDAFSGTHGSAGTLDGWTTKELALFSPKTCDMVANLLSQIEKGAQWPRSTTHAKIAYLEKDGAVVGKVMSFRPITITSPLYRAWASMRLADLKGWIKIWALDEIYAGVPGRGATDAWHEALTDVEELTIDEEHFCGGVTDIAKFFDQIVRQLVYRVAAIAGLPPGILIAYRTFLETMVVHDVLAGWIGTEYRRRCGIPQGCPFSMTFVALLMRPRIIAMRGVRGVKCFILADDVLVLAQGKTMVGAAAEAINKTHEILLDMGAKPAADKSYNFTTFKEGRGWMEQTYWHHLQETIPVMKDFRYLGAHLSTGHKCVSRTLGTRPW